MEITISDTMLPCLLSIEQKAIKQKASDPHDRIRIQGSSLDREVRVYINKKEILQVVELKM
jgi:hypothetical protein